MKDYVDKKRNKVLIGIYMRCLVDLGKRQYFGWSNWQQNKWDSLS